MFDIIQLIQSVKKCLTRKDVLLMAGLLIFYGLTRLVNLLHFPIFSDEGIYIHWAKTAWHDASWRFISLTDGRQPLQTWATIPFLKLFPDNALFAGRLFGVVSGLVSLAGVFSLSWFLFNKRTAYIAALFYIITPFFLFFDRLAMIDSLVNAGFIWLFFFSMLLVRTLRFDVALVFGMVSGLFLLAKSSVSLFVGLSVFAPLVVLKNTVQKNIRTVINYLLLYGVVVILAVLIYNVQRLSPFLHFVSQKNHTFVKTWSEFIQAPFSVVGHNLRYTPLHTAHNLGWAAFIFGLIGFYLIFKKKRWLGFYFLLWILIPYLLTTFFMKVLFSRYIIFLLSPFIIFAAYFLSRQLKKSRLWWGILLTAFFFTFYFDYTILFNYQKTPFLSDDRGQYIEGLPSGYGIREIVEYAREKTKVKPAVIIASGNFGMTGDVLDTFLKRSDQISIQPYWPLEIKDLLVNQKRLEKNYVYVVSAHLEKYPDEWPVKLIKRFDKPGNKSSIYFFELLP